MLLGIGNGRAAAEQCARSQSTVAGAVNAHVQRVPASRPEPRSSRSSLDGRNRKHACFTGTSTSSGICTCTCSSSAVAPISVQGLPKLFTYLHPSARTPNYSYDGQRTPGRLTDVPRHRWVARYWCGLQRPAVGSERVLNQMGVEAQEVPAAWCGSQEHRMHPVRLRLQERQQVRRSALK